MASADRPRLPAQVPTYRESEANSDILIKRCRTRIGDGLPFSILTETSAISSVTQDPASIRTAIGASIFAPTPLSSADASIRGLAGCSTTATIPVSIRVALPAWHCRHSVESSPASWPIPCLPTWSLRSCWN